MNVTVSNMTPEEEAEWVRLAERGELFGEEIPAPSKLAKVLGQLSRWWLFGATNRRSSLPYPVRRRQAEASDRRDALVEFIRDYWQANGFAPSFGEMAAGVGYSSVSPIHTSLWKLSSEGRVAWRPGVARTVRVIETYSKAERGGDTSPTPAARPQGGQE